MNISRLAILVSIMLVCFPLFDITEVKADNENIYGGKVIETTMPETGKEDYNSVKDATVEEINLRYIYNFLTIIILLLAGMSYIALRQRAQRKKVQEQNMLMALRRKHLEKIMEELRDKEQEMRSLNQVQNKILSIIGHDLRGPLGNIYEYFKVYSNADVKMEEEEFRLVMKECSHQMGSLFFLAENLLFWAKNKNSEIKTYPGIYSLKSMAQETKDLLDLFAINKGIALNIDIEQEYLARCDYNQITSVLRNLVSNAIKFTNTGGSIILSCKCLRSEIMFTVQDTGIGMDQEKLNLLLDRKSSFSTPGTDNEPGTGLGISLVSEFVEKNGGKLIGSSRLGQGTSFTFSLPADGDCEDNYSETGSDLNKQEVSAV